MDAVNKLKKGLKKGATLSPAEIEQEKKDNEEKEKINKLKAEIDAAEKTLKDIGKLIEDTITSINNKTQMKVKDGNGTKTLFTKNDKKQYAGDLRNEFNTADAKYHTLVNDLISITATAPTASTASTP